MSIIGNPIIVGGGSTPPTPTPAKAVWSDVNFIDYDGTLLYSYSASDFAALTTLPANPSHTGLTAQGWNWTLTDAKTQVTNSGKCIIGQNYVTSDGATRVYIHLKDRLTPYCGFGVKGTATIDWGDGSAVTTVTGTSLSTVQNSSHTYTTSGDYVISIKVTSTGSSDSIQLFGTSTYPCYLLRAGTSTNASRNRVYGTAIRKIELGNNCTIGDYAFRYCYNLETITIPTSITRCFTAYCFNYCASLKALIAPFGVTKTQNGTLSYCSNLRYVSLPKTMTGMMISDTFRACYSLQAMVLPGTITQLGNNDFNSCYSLKELTLPSTLTGITATSFNSCYSLSTIVVPNGVLTIHGFNSCYSLQQITLSTAATTISTSAFSTNYSLTSIVIPNTVTSIKASAFSNCYGLQYIKFTSTTPPTVDNSNAWSNVPTDCIIYVPTGSLSTYTGETNYPSSSTYTYVEY